jgi:ornithine carbamoyltransferase
VGAKLGMDVRIGAPQELWPAEDHITMCNGFAAASGARLTITDDALKAVSGVDFIYTDVWVSMGDEQGAADKRRALAPYRVDDALLDAAAPGAFALHCLPAHPGEEITAEVLYGPRQRIWEQAENRRHAQKALLELLVGASGDAG